jgi:hypothetical protein
MPSYTFVSTANAFILRGGVPVFVDIRFDILWVLNSTCCNWLPTGSGYDQVCLQGLPVHKEDCDSMCHLIIQEFFNWSF